MAFSHSHIGEVQIVVQGIFTLNFWKQHRKTELILTLYSRLLPNKNKDTVCSCVHYSNKPALHACKNDHAHV